MRFLIYITVGLMLSMNAFASEVTLFTCDEGKITTEGGDYFFGSRALIYSDEGRTRVLADNDMTFHVVNKDTYLVPPINPDGGFSLDILRTVTVEVIIDLQSGEGQIIEVDEEKESTETELHNCSI